MALARSYWPQFPEGTDKVQWQLFRNGEPHAFDDLPGDATEKNFEKETGHTYTAEVRGVTATVNASIDLGSSEGGGGG